MAYRGRDPLVAVRLPASMLKLLDERGPVKLRRVGVVSVVGLDPGSFAWCSKRSLAVTNAVV